MALIDKQAEILIVTTVFFGLAWIFVLLRCYVRAVLLRAFGPDDTITICALLLFSVGMGLVFKGVYSGFGLHTVDMTAPIYASGLKYWCIVELLYVPTVVLIKSSIALYLIRIAVKPSHIWAVCISMGIFVAYSIVFFVVLVLQCRPLSFYWRQAIGATDGKCLDPMFIAGIAFGHGGGGVLTDIILGIIPAFIVQDLQITRRTKIAVALTLALGSVASFTTIVRLPTLRKLTHTDDYLYTVTNVIMLSVVEMSVGLIACCLATLKPLLRSFLDWSENSLGGSTGRLNSRMMGGFKGTRQLERDGTELSLRPDLKIIGFETIISSNGRESVGAGHTTVKRSIDVRSETWYLPEDDTSSKGILINPEPAYYIKR